MVSTPTIREYILNADKLPLIHTVVAEGVTQYGMQTFDQSVLALLREGLITEEEALRNCNNPNELSLKLKGISAASDRTWQAVDAATGDKPVPGASAASSGGRSSDWMTRE
jgi:twitching motility protein PilT